MRTQQQYTYTEDRGYPGNVYQVEQEGYYEALHCDICGSELSQEEAAINPNGEDFCAHCFGDGKAKVYYEKLGLTEEEVNKEISLINKNQ